MSSGLRTMAKAKDKKKEEEAKAAEAAEGAEGAEGEVAPKKVCR